MDLEKIAKLPVEFEIFSGDNRSSGDDDAYGPSSTDEPVQVQEPSIPLPPTQYPARNIFSEDQLRRIGELLADGGLPEKILVFDRRTYDDMTADVEFRIFSVSLVYQSGKSRKTIYSESKKGWGECGTQVTGGQKLDDLKF